MLALLLLACDGSDAALDDTGAGETDVDDTAETAETADTDTGSGERPECGDATAARPHCSTCAELLAELPGTPDGPATIERGGVAFDTFCDMTTAGGGWTLAATNGWGGAWTAESVLDDALFGEASLTADYKGEAMLTVPFRDLLFETDLEYAVYLDVGDGGLSYKTFQDTVPLHNCGIDTPYEWEMAEGTLDDPDICSTNLYIHPIDWEGGLIPCGDSEVATGPAWSGMNKDLGCPLNDPRGTSFIEDPWDYNMWGDHDPYTPNAPLRMWVR